MIQPCWLIRPCDLTVLCCRDVAIATVAAVQVGWNAVMSHLNQSAVKNENDSEAGGKVERDSTGGRGGGGRGGGGGGGGRGAADDSPLAVAAPA